jgi:hypothetical protein
LAAKIAAGRAQDVVALRESAKHENVEQHEYSKGSSPAMDEIQRMGAQGREDWLAKQDKAADSL